MHWAELVCLLVTLVLGVVIAGPSVWRDWKDEQARETGPFAYPEEEPWTS